MDFIEKVKDIDLPYNFILKKADIKKNIYGFKTESFIFDNFIYSKKTGAMLDDKQNFYAPLKDLNSLDDIKKILNLGKQSLV